MNKSTHFDNTPVNTEAGDEHDGKKLWNYPNTWTKYVQKIYFDGSKESLHEPSKTYVCIPPTSETKFSVNKRFSRNKLDYILKGKNTTVRQLDYMVNNVTDVSLYD